MLACIPTKGNAGRDDTVFSHFGSAPFFTLYDSANDEVRVVENRNAHHEHGTCHPMAHLSRYKIDCVVCGGMGMRAILGLNAEGVKVYQAHSGTVGEAIAMIKEGNLPEMDPRTACRGHGQRGGCGHDTAAADGVTHAHLRGTGGGRGAGRGQGRGGDRNA